MPTGRPTKYTAALADKICARLAMGESVRTVCADEKMPAMSTVFEWLRKHEAFQEQYARAKQESADAMAEEVLDIADDGRNDWMKARGGYIVNREATERSKLRVETRKWLMAKMKPKKYGDKLDLTSDGAPLPTPILAGITGTTNAIPANDGSKPNTGAK